MQQFLFIAAVHFLALLSPGPDFFLIARTSLFSGWRVASGACWGIALANGVFIIAAFTGTAALRPAHPLFAVLQLAGCAYLTYLGVLFICHAGSSQLSGSAEKSPVPRKAPVATWWRAVYMGFLSGILNPKNALFYASLAAMLADSHGGMGWKAIYGFWMFSVVLLWDLLIAVFIGNPYVLQRFARALPWLERITGLFLILLALGITMALFISDAT